MVNPNRRRSRKSKAGHAVGIILLFVAFCYGTTLPEVVTWSKSLRLQWSDYQGVVPGQSEHGAVTTYEVRRSNSFPDWHHVACEVKCVMIKERSWVKPELRADSVLLNHERLHFDIAECSARSLRCSLQRERVSALAFNERFQMLADSIHGSWGIIEELYDAETNHGTIPSEQAKWGQQISHILDSLTVYSEQRFVVELLPPR